MARPVAPTPHRPGADRDVRDGHQPQARIRMAAGHDHRQADRRTGQGLQFPGVANSWTMPIKARIDMLSTGIRTPSGSKVFGKDLGEMERLARQIESVVKTVPGTTSAFAERITGGFYLNIEPDGTQLARYGPGRRRPAGSSAGPWAARWSPPPSKAASASASTSATRRSCVPIRRMIAREVLVPPWTAP